MKKKIQKNEQNYYRYRYRYLPVSLIPPILAMIMIFRGFHIPRVYRKLLKNNHWAKFGGISEPGFFPHAAMLTSIFCSRPKIGFFGHLIFYLLSFWPTVTALTTPLPWAVHFVTMSPIDVANKIMNAIWAPEGPLNAWKVIPIHFQGAQGHFGSHLTNLKWPIAV